MSHAFSIRPEEPEDAGPIRDLLVAAFAGPAEARLVDTLRADGDLVLSLVALHETQVIGHVAFSPVAIEGAGAAVALAPLAVAAGWRRRGVGAALVGAAHRALAEGGEALSFVLGDPAYYGRFGYAREAAVPFEAPWSWPHFMALRLRDAGPAGGRLAYARAFAALS